jgi:hypothetical protein
VIAHDDQFWRKPDLRHRQFESLSPRQGRLQMQRSSDEGDARMPERGQMLYRLPDSILIVNADVSYSRHVGSDVNEYQRNLTETKVFDQRVFHAEGQDRHPIHPALDHASHRRFHAFRVVHGGGDQYLVVVFDRLILEGLYDLREKRVGNLRDD